MHLVYVRKQRRFGRALLGCPLDVLRVQNLEDEGCHGDEGAGGAGHGVQRSHTVEPEREVARRRNHAAHARVQG